ncbi:hypothetical protein [Phenylobacterium sp. SCN 70-31]|uniref:hypothetical protein n=1 Tax=Phenylobacterium sp. SCN 70-31 TaxID=1660129 RepID=UPI00086CAAE7|nr:hypothetical protein [Phenylobacterium sp. SCN 70-31]ODT88129.1 MAG: hypothetical protein ABS78_09565 [Phenylobacterium sp. SCN 70-31]
MTPAERQRWRGMWAALVRSSIIPDPEALARLAPEARSWASPLTSRSQSYALFAFRDLAYAFVQAGAAEKRAVADVLSDLARLADRYLAEQGPPQNGLPFRADLDG